MTSTGGVVIHSTHPWGAIARTWETVGPGSGAWPTANKAFYQPLYIPETTTMTHFVYYGDTASGNICMALYNSSGTRLATTGSQVMLGGTQAKRFAVSYTMTRGTYYMGMSIDNTTGSVMKYAPGVEILRLAGCFQETSAFVLPATATFAVMTASYMPLMGITTQTPHFS